MLRHLSRTELRRHRSALADLEASLIRRGFLTVRAARRARGPAPDAVALRRAGVGLLALVLVERQVDRRSTRERIAACARRGPTVVAVPWHLEPRLRSNLERWRIRARDVTLVSF